MQMEGGHARFEELHSHLLELLSHAQAWTLHAAWAITYGAMLTVICVAVTAVCAATFLRHTDPSLLFTVIALFAGAELAFGLLVASLFSSAKIAGIAAPLAHFACLLPRYIFFRTGAPQASIKCLFVFPSALHLLPHGRTSGRFCFLFSALRLLPHGRASGKLWVLPSAPILHGSASGELPLSFRV